MDGHHVSNADMKLILEVASNRMVFVTDAMAAAGQPDGDYTIGNLEVKVESGVARLKSNNSLAGSTLTMAQAVAHARNVGLSENLISSATQTIPAELLDRTR